jgi:NAD(P)-dependent dehydrogenase (short-subunit alcohol dehydrogenase family)
MQALVTGANRGLGLALVQALLARGDRVVACCRHPGRAGALNALAGEHPNRLHLLPLDVAKPASIRELAAELPLVCERLDLLVNNAGLLVSGERFGTLDPEALDASFRTNAMGPLLLTEALADRLADGARVANLSSVMGAIGEVSEFRAPSYAISKAAQNMATAQLAHALAPRGIVVVALHPGWVQTEMGGPKATVAPEQSAAGLLEVIAGLRPADSGRFLDWRGKPLPW